MYSQRSRSKSIKKITILSRRDPSLSDRTRTTNKENEEIQLCEGRSRRGNNSCVEIIYKNKCREVDELRRMIEQMRKKEKRQTKIIKELRQSNRQYEEIKTRNKSLKEELIQLKELMKSVLLEREEERMFTFYKND